MHNRGNRHFIGMTLASALLAGGLGACSKTETSASLVAEAKQFQQQGNDKAAIIQLKNALVKSPDDAEARYLLATIYNETDDPASAEKEIRRAMALKMDPERTMPVLAEALLRQQQPQKVLDAMKELAPDGNAQLLALQGDAYLALQRWADADAAFDKALAANADFPKALLGKARGALMRRDLDTGRKLVDQALAKHPKDVEVLLFKGDLERALGQPDAAVANYDKVIALTPGNGVARVQKAFTLIEADRYDAAQAEIAAAHKAVPNSLALIYAQALLNFKLGKYAAANESLQQVLRVVPDYGPAVLLAGAVQFALGSMPQAEQHLRRFLETDPQNRYARKMLASTLLRKGDAAGALAALGPAPGDDKDEQLLGIAGQAAMGAGDFGKATAYFQKASAIAPKTATFHTALGLSQIGLGERERGIGELELASKMDDATLSSGVTLVTSALRLHQLDKALEAVTALEKRQPDNALIQNLKGLVYLGRNDVATARASFEKAAALAPDFLSPVDNLAKLDSLQHKPQEAGQRLAAFVKKNPASVEGLTALADHLVAQQKPAEATAMLLRASTLDQKSAAPGLRLAQHYMRTGQANEALALLRKMQVQFPADPNVLDLLAQAQWAGADKAAALETLNKLALALPHSAQVQYRLAIAHDAVGNKSAALDALGRALQLQPEYPEAQAAQATMLIEQGQGQKALAVARALERQQPKAALGFVLEGDAQMQARQPAPAAAAYEKALALNKTTAIMIKLHQALSGAGKQAQADARLAEWRTSYPKDMHALLYSGEAALGQGRYPAAAAAFEAVLQHAPDNVPALNNLAWTYLQMHDARALPMAEKASRAAPANPTVMDTLGWILVEQGQGARGLALLQKAAQAAPGAADVRLHLARALIKANDRAGARRELEALVAANRPSAQLDEARTLLKQL